MLLVFHYAKCKNRFILYMKVKNGWLAYNNKVSVYIDLLFTSLDFKKAELWLANACKQWRKSHAIIFTNNSFQKMI